MRPAALPFALLLLYGTLGGLAFSVAKTAAGHGVSPAGYAFWQCAGAGTVTLTFCLFRGRGVPVTPATVRFFTVTGLLCLAIPSAIMFLALAHIPAGTMAIAIATMPLFTCALSVLLKAEALTLRRGLGIACGFVGIAIMLAPHAGQPAPDMALWLLLALSTPALFAYGNIFVARHRPQDVDVFALTSGMLVTAALGLLVFGLTTGGFYAFRAPFGAAEYLILAQIAISSLGYVLFFEIIRLAGPVYFSQIGYLVTVTGMIFGASFLGERYGVWVFAAAGIVFIGVAIVNRAAPRAAGQS